MSVIHWAVTCIIPHLLIPLFHVEKGSNLNVFPPRSRLLSTKPDCTLPDSQAKTKTHTYTHTHKMVSHSFTRPLILTMFSICIICRWIEMSFRELCHIIASIPQCLMKWSIHSDMPNQNYVATDLWSRVLTIREMGWLIEWGHQGDKGTV